MKRKRKYTLSLTTGELAILAIAAKTNHESTLLWIEKEKLTPDEDITKEDLENYAKDSKSLLDEVQKLVKDKLGEMI